MKTRDELQQQHQTNGTAVSRGAPLPEWAGDLALFDERLSLLEDAQYTPGARPLKRRPITVYVGAAWATVNLLSMTAVYWLRLFGVLEVNQAVLSTVTFGAMAVLSAIIGSSQKD